MKGVLMPVIIAAACVCSVSLPATVCAADPIQLKQADLDAVPDTGLEKIFTLSDGGEYELSENITTDVVIVVPDGATVTINLKGKVLNFTGDANIRNNGGSITIRDKGGGKIKAGNYVFDLSPENAVSKAELILESGTFEGRIFFTRVKSNHCSLSIGSNADFTLPFDSDLMISSNATIVNDGVMHNDGYITNLGAIINNGVIDGAGELTDRGEYSGNEPTCRLRRPVKNITFDREVLTLQSGDTYQLTSDITPVNSTESVTYISDNDKVASVDATGKVTALSVGVATITAKTFENQLEASCVVNVEEAVLPTDENTDMPIDLPEEKEDTPELVQTAAHSGEADVKTEGENTGNVKTSDTTRTGCYITLAVSSFVAAGICVFLKKRRRKIR